MSDLPQPLTPADCDLSDFQYMELDVRQLRDSKFAASVDAEAFRAGVLLWCAAWHQIPAGSLPDDDVELANLAGFGRVIKEWKKVRAEALYGFVKCSDGRLYHQVVAKKALAAYQAKLQHAYEKMLDRLRKENRKRELAGQETLPIPTFEQWNSERQRAGIPQPEAQSSAGIPPESVDGSAGIPPENALKGNRTEQNGTEQNGEGEVNLKPKPLSDPPAAAGKPAKAGMPKPTKPAPETGPTWDAYSAAYRQRYGVDPVRNAKVNGMLANVVKRLGATEAPLVAAFYLLHQGRNYVLKLHSVDLLVNDCEKLRTEWATRTQMTATKAQQQDQTQTTYDAFAPLIAEAEAQEARERNAHGQK